MRPDRLVVVVGTGTEVGKTWVSVRLIGALQGAGWFVESRKPAQSFDPEDAHPTDAALLAEASGEETSIVCPPEYSYPVPLAPPMAAQALGREAPSIEDFAAGLRWSGIGAGGRPFVGLVETAGGVRSPFGRDGDAVDFVRILLPEVLVMVAHAGLGTINAVRLSADALRPSASPAEAAVGRRIDPIIVLNRYSDMDDVHVRNREWLETRDGFRVVVMPGGDGELAQLVTGGLVMS